MELKITVNGKASKQTNRLSQEFEPAGLALGNQKAAQKFKVSLAYLLSIKANLRYVRPCPSPTNPPKLTSCFLSCAEYIYNDSRRGDI